MVKQIQIVAFAIIVIAVTALNVNTVLDSNRSYDLNMTTIAAISGGEDGGDSGEGGDVGGESGGDITWSCSTQSSFVDVQKGFCMSCNNEHIISIWDTRVCNDGVLTWCYPGYIVTYYDCNGKVTNVFDDTSMSGCL